MPKIQYLIRSQHSTEYYFDWWRSGMVEFLFGNLILRVLRSKFVISQNFCISRFYIPTYIVSGVHRLHIHTYTLKLLLYNVLWHGLSTHHSWYSFVMKELLKKIIFLKDMFKENDKEMPDITKQRRNTFKEIFGKQQ